MATQQQETNERSMTDLIRLLEEWLKIGQHKAELIAGIFFSVLGGLIKWASGVFFLIGWEIIGRVFEASLVALFSGFLGALGVHLWDKFKKKFLKK